MCRDNADKLMALTREVCALKLVESRLQASLAAAQGNYDAALARMQRLDSQQAHAAPQGNPASWQQCTPDDATAAADLLVTLAARDAQLHDVRTQMLELRHSKEEGAAKLQHCNNLLESTKTELIKSKESTASALAALREELSAEARAERDALVNDLEAGRARVEELQRRLGEQVLPPPQLLGVLES